MNKPVGIVVGVDGYVIQTACAEAVSLLCLSFHNLPNDMFMKGLEYVCISFIPCYFKSKLSTFNWRKCGLVSRTYLIMNIFLCL